MSQAQEKQNQKRKSGKLEKREEELRVGNLNSVDAVPSEMTLRSKKAVNANSILKDVFITLPSNSLKALARDKEGDLRNHFVQNLDFAMLSKNFSWLSNSALTIPAVAE